ncbi:MAG: hypothetical protein WCF85_02700 [Rhodospirillaceae bacterium]
MTRFVVFMIGPYRLMVDALRVRELLVCDAGGRISGGGHLSWRGLSLTEIGLATLLGVIVPAEAGAVDLVYGEENGESGPTVAFRADRVLGLRALTVADILPLPPLATPQLAHLFAGLCLDPTDRKGILWLDARPAMLLELWRDHNHGSGARHEH